MLGQRRGSPYRPTVAAEAVPFAGVAPSVLIIDDDRDVRDYFADVFGFEGFAVTVLSDPFAVIGRLRAEHFDVVVVGMWMPKLDGLALLERIRAADAEILVIMISSYPTGEDRAAATALGILTFVVHPITPSELRETIALVRASAAR
jgi:two-component system, NtrC family, C4-dicarboxylate transport response regulator DctD